MTSMMMMMMIMMMLMMMMMMMIQKMLMVAATVGARKRYGHQCVFRAVLLGPIRARKGYCTVCTVSTNDSDNRHEAEA